MRNQTYRLVSRYVGREYLLSLIVAFTFFFFIFFINQILLIAQKILVKNVSLASVFKLVMLAIPQFLLYTFPFSSLTASAMVLGDLSASNEVLAMRSSGISMRHVFYPICIFSLCLSCVTLYTADYLLPESSRNYKEMYVSMMRDLPTIELASYGANTVGDRVLSNGKAEGGEVEDLVLFTIGNGKDRQVITAPSSSVTLEDPVNFIYRMDLSSPRMLQLTDTGYDNWSLADAGKATLYLDFSNQIPSLTDTVPSQLSLGELQTKIKEKKISLDSDRNTIDNNIRQDWNDLANLSLSDSHDYMQYASDVEKMKRNTSNEPIVFYLQYYRAEYHKKWALSLACFLLVFLTFPLSYRRLKHGRLIGFGIAMFSAVAYWYLLFFAQMYIFKTSFNPLFLIWMPDILLFLIGVVLIWRTKR